MGFWSHFLGFDPNRLKSFPGQQPGEEVEYMGVFHWTVLAPFVFQMVVIIGALILINVYSGFFQDLSPMTRLYINSLSIGALLHIICFRLFNYFLKVMIITNYRLIEIRHSVVLHREREVIPMTNIQDFRYQQNGLIARIFGFGDLLVLGSSSDVKYKFNHVPKVDKVHHLLGEIHQKAVNRHGSDFFKAQMNQDQRSLKKKSKTIFRALAPDAL